MKEKFSRRDFLKIGALSAVGLGGTVAVTRLGGQSPRVVNRHDNMSMGSMASMQGMPGPVGEVDHLGNGFNPSDILTDFDYGQVSTLASGQTLREFTINAHNREIEIMPGIAFPAWTYNGRIPGPTLRADEGDHIRVHFTNAGDMPHTMHFHGFHPSEMDGVPGAGPGLIHPGGQFTYEFDALPFGLHLYHCHAFPLARHIAKGLYGAFITDPKQGRPKVDHEFVMVMSGFDIDFDDENDFYAVNAIPFHYQLHPIEIRVGEKVRIYLVNILEFDLINSFHLHANFFDYYPTGTSLTPAEFTDTIMQTQAQRGILEFSYRYPGEYMFHAHQSEFAELGWMGLFRVSD
jgi:FtsP/CotA-like multicopper oxidase with cupredoxin domain